MNRCFVDRTIWREPEIELSAEESHHLLDVLRAKPGETIEIFDGCGRTAQAELLAGKKNIARIKVIPESIRKAAPPCPAFTLLQAVPKHSGMDLIIQKATELGVKTIVPLITERTVVKFNDQSANQRVERWQKVALAAVKQCRSAWLPEIFPIVPLAEAVAGLQADLKIFGALVPQALHFKETLAQVPRATIKSIALLIGPEGDLTEEETKLLLQSKFMPVSFGSEVLRVETAAMFGLSVLNYEFCQERQKEEGRRQNIL